MLFLIMILFHHRHLHLHLHLHLRPLIPQIPPQRQIPNNIQHLPILPNIIQPPTKRLHLHLRPRIPQIPPRQQIPNKIHHIRHLSAIFIIFHLIQATHLAKLHPSVPPKINLATVQNNLPPLPKRLPNHRVRNRKTHRKRTRHLAHPSPTPRRTSPTFGTMVQPPTRASLRSNGMPQAAISTMTTPKKSTKKAKKCLQFLAIVLKDPDSIVCRKTIRTSCSMAGDKSSKRLGLHYRRSCRKLTSMH